MELTSGKFITNLMIFFCNHCLIGLDNLTPHANWLIGAFGVIALCSRWALYWGDFRMQDLIGYILKIGFFIFMVNNWKEITIDIIYKSFEFAGLVASGTTIAATPSDILDVGIFMASKVMAMILGTTQWMAVMGILPYLLVTLLFCFVVYASFGFMAIQVFLTTVEYHIFACLSVILVPFGILKYTSFLFQRVFTGLFSYGMKIAVLTFIIGLGKQSFNMWTTPVPSVIGQIDTLVQAAFGTLVYAFVVWKIPNIAAGMINGMPSLEAGDAVQGVKAIGGAAVTAASMGLAGTGAVAAAANAAQGSSLRTKAVSFGKNLGYAGFEATKQAAFGNNFIRAHRNASRAIKKHSPQPPKTQSPPQKTSSPSMPSQFVSGDGDGI